MKIRHDEVRFQIANITVSLRIGSDHIRRMIRSRYKDFISTARPNLFIDIECKGRPRPDFAQLLFQTQSWQLGEKNGRLILYFLQGDYGSLAKFNARLDRVKFYIQDPSGRIILYFLQILFILVLPKYQAVMLHGCGILLHGKKGCLFIAQSGGGKSTIAKLADKQGLTILNDDRIIATREKGRFKIYGSPWHGEVEKVANKDCVIKNIFFLEKAAKNYIFSLKSTRSMLKLVRNSFYFPINLRLKKQVSRFCLAMVGELRCYRFGFKPDKSIWRYLDEFSG
jgi:hypothetical protein